MAIINAPYLAINLYIAVRAPAVRMHNEDRILDLEKLLEKVETAPTGSPELDSEFAKAFPSAQHNVTNSIDAVIRLIETAQISPKQYIGRVVGRICNDLVAAEQAPVSRYVHTDIAGAEKRLRELKSGSIAFRVNGTGAFGRGWHFLSVFNAYTPSGDEGALLTAAAALGACSSTAPTACISVLGGRRLD